MIFHIKWFFIFKGLYCENMILWIRLSQTEGLVKSHTHFILRCWKSGSNDSTMGSKMKTWIGKLKKKEIWIVASCSRFAVLQHFKLRAFQCTLQRFHTTFWDLLKLGRRNAQITEVKEFEQSISKVQFIQDNIISYRWTGLIPDWSL